MLEVATLGITAVRGNSTEGQLRLPPVRFPDCLRGAILLTRPQPRRTGRHHPALLSERRLAARNLHPSVRLRLVSLPPLERWRYTSPATTKVNTKQDVCRVPCSARSRWCICPFVCLHQDRRQQGEIDVDSSLYIEADIQLLGMSFSVNPDDPTTATVNFGVTSVTSAFGLT